MFRQAFERRRCLVPADGFYEWQRNTPKQPYFIRMNNNDIMAFGGVWERWKPADAGDPVDTFSIITTTPNELMKPIHERMPVILRRDDYARWLDRDVAGEAVMDLLRPYDVEEMTATAVGTHVNNTNNDDAECIRQAIV